MNRNPSRAAMLASVLALAGGGFGIASNVADPVHELRNARGQESTTTQRSVEKSTPSRLGERNAIAKAMFGGMGRGRPARFPNGPGWTHAHVARMKSKRKNKVRNKRAHRG